MIAITGVLLSLLIPVVQAAREASRRLGCQVKQANLSKALNAFESTKGRYPVGAHNSWWMTWLVQLLPYIEEQAIANRYNHDRTRYSPETRFNSESNKDVTQTFIPLLACPSDGFAPIRTTMPNEPSAHSYVGCTGNGVYVATRTGWMSKPPRGTPGGPLPTPGYGNGMFRWQGGALVMSGATPDMDPPEDSLEIRDPMTVKVAEVTDGLSNTLVFSEVIRRPPQPDGRSADLRGLSWWGPGSLFTTIVPPNTSYPDIMPGRNDCGPESWALEPPCYGPHGRSMPVAMAARSRHPGGVVASRLDGSVHFYLDSVEPATWEAMGTTQGREVVP